MVIERLDAHLRSNSALQCRYRAVARGESHDEPRHNRHGAENRQVEVYLCEKGDRRLFAPASAFQISTIEGRAYDEDCDGGEHAEWPGTGAEAEGGETSDSGNAEARLVEAGVSTSAR